MTHITYHSFARANLYKSKKVLTSTTTASKYIPKRPRICINWNPSFQTSLHKIFKNCYLLSKLCFTMFTFRGSWVWKGVISIDAFSGPLGYVFWCCGSKSHDFFTFIQIGSGYTVLCDAFSNLNALVQPFVLLSFWGHQTSL